MGKNLKLLVLSSVFAAMVFVATISVQIPLPGQGYLNFGDLFVLLAAFLLGPIPAAASAMVGSALADIISGYAIYAPATALIKASMALLAAWIFSSVGEKKTIVLSAPLGAVTAECLMVVGYYLYDFLLLKNPFAALLSVPGNAMQALCAAVLAPVLYFLLRRAGLVTILTHMKKE